MENSPCTFTINPDPSRADLIKLGALRAKLIDEIRKQDDDVVNRIRNGNLLTWIEFKLGNVQAALEANNNVLEWSNDSDMAALANKVHLLQLTHQDASAAKARLAEVHRRLGAAGIAAAKADQAFSYSRIGGPANQQSTIDLYEEALQTCPDNVHWKFGLALAYRRTVHEGMSDYQNFKSSFQERTKKAAKFLFDIVQSPDATYRKRGFAELSFLRVIAQGSRKLPLHEMNVIFKNMSVRDLKQESQRTK
ncbi:uncharacterized protein LOC131954047 [Physella acuta]|uniref:uncharacterized protein LOC131954047 n=1 Tax=Physella acuta TaxID=109671 RepID=UPI0027DB3B58|nr:uncharacterized protein LOC131954047 [Physella acuta]XP_059173514.1 uncharacterized protein LOC131954047 [Physella acuta]